VGTRRRKFVAVDLSAFVCPRCGRDATGALVVDAQGTHAAMRCERCGCVPVSEVPTIVREKCSQGDAIEVPFIAVLDEHPELMDLGLPIYTAEEWEVVLPTLTPTQLARNWKARIRAIAAERKDRAAKAGRTVEEP